MVHTYVPLLKEGGICDNVQRQEESFEASEAESYNCEQSTQTHEVFLIGPLFSLKVSFDVKLCLWRQWRSPRTCITLRHGSAAPHPTVISRAGQHRQHHKVFLRISLQCFLSFLGFFFHRSTLPHFHLAIHWGRWIPSSFESQDELHPNEIIRT